MPTVYIPSLLQNLTGGKGRVEARGSTVRDVIQDLEKSHPGVRDRLIDNGQLRANISVAVDGEITPLGLLEEVDEDSEIHFVAAIKGGLGCMIDVHVSGIKHHAEGDSHAFRAGLDCAKRLALGGAKGGDCPHPASRPRPTKELSVAF